MKYSRAFSAMLVFLCCASGTVRARANCLEANDLVAICGDSITEEKDYSVDLEDYLVMCQPVPRVEAMQFGWNGETAAKFLRRAESNVLPFSPTVVTTCYGMNDGGYGKVTRERLDIYRESLGKMIALFKKNGVRVIVVGGPGAVDSDSFYNNVFKGIDSPSYNHTLSELSKVACDVATREGVRFADVHTPMVEAMRKAKARYGPLYTVSGKDGVHPGANGSLVMAYAFLKALGCDGQIGTLTVDLKGKARRLQRDMRSIPFTGMCSTSPPPATRFVSMAIPRNPLRPAG